MKPPETKQSGTGGGLRYLTEHPSHDMVNQEQSYSCQVACARQLLFDAGVVISEADLLHKIGYIEGWGTSASNTSKILDELHPSRGYAGGAVDPIVIPILFSRGPWIASLRTDGGTIHAVIVDSLEEEVVLIRDPWGLFGPGSGSGTRASIKVDDFLEHWQFAVNNAVFPNRIKRGES